ncbi:hypothetical protein Gotur_033824 [Gossypium turneri]
MMTALKEEISNLKESFIKLGTKKDKYESSEPKFKPRGNGGGDKDKVVKNSNDCPKKVTFSTLEANDEKDEVTKNLNSIIRGVKDKMGRRLMFIDITMADKRLNALVVISASDLLMSK